MENKITYRVVIAILVIALIIMGVCLFKSHNEISDLRSGNESLNGGAFTLTACENITTPDQEAACVGRLVQISKQLSTYEEKLKSIKVPTQ